MSKTMAVHVRYIPLYISLLSSAKQELEVTIFRVVWGTRRRRLIFRIRIWNWTRPMHIHPEHVFRAIGVLNRPKQCEFRWQNINLFGTQHHRRRCSSFLWFCTCVLNLGTFRTRHLQNNNVKWRSHYILWRTHLPLELNSVISYLAWASF